MVYLGVQSSGAAKKRPNGWRYRRVRASFLARNPLCAVCFERGLTVAAAEVHHTRPVKDHPDLFCFGWSSIGRRYAGLVMQRLLRTVSGRNFGVWTCRGTWFDTVHFVRIVLFVRFRGGIDEWCERNFVREKEAAAAAQAQSSVIHELEEVSAAIEQGERSVQQIEADLVLLRHRRSELLLKAWEDGAV